jgi:hypothetical protein
VLISAAPEQKPRGFSDDLAPDRFAMKPLEEPTLAALLADLLGLDWEYAVDVTEAKTPGVDPSTLARIAHKGVAALR